MKYYKELYNNLASKLLAAKFYYNDPKLANFGIYNDKIIIIDFVDSFARSEGSEGSSLPDFDELIQPYIDYYKKKGHL